MGLFAFFVTVTLFFFLPGVFEASAGGFPAISAMGGFLLKDAVLFSGCFACLADSLDLASLDRRAKVPAGRRTPDFNLLAFAGEAVPCLAD